MKILLSGAHIENKGDELMLYAVREHLRTVRPDVELVRAWGSSSYEYLAKMGFLRLIPRPPKNRIQRWVPYAVLTRYRRSLGLVSDSELNAIIDFAGFSYTDEWGPHNVEVAARQFERARKHGARIVMLPQSFGPFSNSRTISAMSRMVEQCELVYARDRQSLEMLQGIVGKSSSIRQAPDLTHLIPGEVPPDFDASVPRGMIVPNHWLVRKQNGDSPDRYYRFLAAAVKTYKKLGLEPLVVLHAPFQDRELVAGLEAACGFRVPVAPYENPVYLKGILGTAKVAVGSRFHALIGLLSQGVPAIGIGWSHKFQELFDEYAIGDCILSASDDTSALEQKIESLVAGSNRDTIIARLNAAFRKHSETVQRMWCDVDLAVGVVGKPSSSQSRA